jgi:hypothetical protein
MFSYSEYPLKSSSKINETIDFAKLVKIIKNHPKSDVIEKVRKLRSEGKDEECRRIKQSLLPWITPNCVVNQRSLKDKFEENFIHSSGYIYFDIDENIKESFISEYGQFVSLVTTSSSGRGISILVRINRSIISNDDYLMVYDFIKDTLFKGIRFDDMVRSLGCAWIIPWDKEPFINYEYEFCIPETLEIDKSSSDVLYTHPLQIRRLSPSLKKETDEIDSDDLDRFFPYLILETKIEFEGQYLILPTPILKIGFRIPIVDGTKHKVYRKLIHDLIYLNPNATHNQITRFLMHINYNYAIPKMQSYRLKNLVSSYYYYIKNNPNYINTSHKSLRVIHYQKRNIIPSNIRTNLSNKMRGLLDRMSTWRQIQNTISKLLDEYGEYTYKDISENTGYSISTIKRHHLRKKVEFEMEYESILKEINDTLKKVLNN